MLGICNVHILSHPLNEHQEQIILLEGVEGISDFTLWVERAWIPFCCHGNVTKDIPWNFMMNITTVQSFKMSSEIFHFL